MDSTAGYHLDDGSNSASLEARRIVSAVHSDDSGESVATTAAVCILDVAGERNGTRLFYQCPKCMDKRSCNRSSESKPILVR